MAEVDGGYFGGYVKPANLARTARDRRFAENQSGKRKAVVVIRERDGNTLPAVFRIGRRRRCLSSARASPRARSSTRTKSANWNELHSRFEMKRINHEEAYSLDGACTNWAEEFFSRMRRAEIGHHHHIAGAYLLRYAQEASWREDNRRSSNGDQVNRVAGWRWRASRAWISPAIGRGRTSRGGSRGLILFPRRTIRESSRAIPATCLCVAQARSLTEERMIVPAAEEIEVAEFQIKAQVVLRRGDHDPPTIAAITTAATNLYSIECPRFCRETRPHPAKTGGAPLATILGAPPTASARLRRLAGPSYRH